MEDDKGKTSSPRQIGAFVLTKDEGASRGIPRPTSAQCCYLFPAYFTNSQHQARPPRTLDQISGLEVLHVINKTTMTALSYGMDQAGDKLLLRTYHLDGSIYAPSNSEQPCIQSAALNWW